MTRLRTRRNALLLALALAPVAAPAAAGATPRVAFVGAPGSNSASAAAAATAAARAAAEAAREAGVDAVFPDEVARTLHAKPEAAKCGTDAACAVATCGAVGADFVVAAAVSDTGSAWVIEMRLRDAKRGSLRGQGSETVLRQKRLARDAAGRLGKRLVSPLLSSGELPPPVGHSAPSAATTTPSASATASAASPESPNDTPAPASTPSPDARLQPEAQAASEPAPNVRRRLGTVLAASGVALIAGGATVGAFAWSASNDASFSLARGDLGGFMYGRQSSRTLAWTGIALGGVGGVALAAGAWLRFGGGSSRISLGVEPAAPGARVAIAF